MPSKLRQAIGAVKDHTTIRLAKLASSSDLDIAILKATTHDEAPADDRRLTEIHLLLCASYTTPTAIAATFAGALSRRISRTRNWVVALKSLLVVFRVLRDCAAHFDHNALRRRRILDLSDFQDVSSRTRPYDFTGFVRTYAAYLDARLDAAAAGKTENLSSQPSVTRRNLAGAQPAWALERVVQWQRLLERAIATRPTGIAKKNRLVQIALYSVVRETFSLYRNIFDGLSIILNDDRIRRQRGLCAEVLRACAKAASQFDELESFYELCNNIGVGRTSEYPDVQKIPESMVRNLDELMMNSPSNSRSSSPDGNVIEEEEEEKVSDDHKHVEQEWELALVESLRNYDQITNGENQWQLVEYDDHDHDQFSSDPFFHGFPQELMDLSAKQHLILREQQVWIQQQRKIIDKSSES